MMPITLGDGRVLKMWQYSSRIVRATCPAMRGPERVEGRECSWYVVGVGAVFGGDSEGDLVVALESGLPVYRASVASLLEARARYPALGPENGVGRVQRPSSPSRWMPRRCAGSPSRSPWRAMSSKRGGLVPATWCRRFAPPLTA